MLLTIFECKYCYLHILSLVIFIIEIVRILLDFTPKKLIQRGGGLKVCCKRMWFLVHMKGAPPRVLNVKIICTSVKRCQSMMIFAPYCLGFRMHLKFCFYVCGRVTILSEFDTSFGTNFYFYKHKYYKLKNF